jgi:phage tail-like protein
MKIQRFAACADLVGRRNLIGWHFTFEPDETLAQIPRVVVRRNVRDFAFAPIVPDDPTVMYDSADFPSATETMTELPPREATEDGLRAVTIVESAARPLSGRMIEVRRRSTTTIFDARNRPQSQQVELLDTGHFPNGLIPATTYYYQIESSIIPTSDEPAPYRAVATAGESYGMARTLYEQMPSVYRRHDVRTRPITPGTDSIPELMPRAGQLRRFTDLFGVALDSLRSSAEGLRTLHDLDNVDYRFLPLMARWIGWDLSFNAPIAVQRNEIKSAPTLYKSTGTIPNLRALVNYYTGWNSQIAEFAQFLARSNTAPQCNIFALQATSDTWRSPVDAAVVFDFLSTAVTGSASLPAAIESSASEPFALRPGMKLVIALDGGLPEVIQFWPGDFTDIFQATAAEISAVFNRLLYSAEAVALPDGRITIRTYQRGADAAIEIREAAPEMVSLEGAPQGTLAAAIDALGRIRLCYEAEGAIRYKTMVQGTWRDSRTALPECTTPAIVRLADNTLRLFGIQQGRIIMATGTSRPPRQAAISGMRSELFALAPGSTLTFRLNHTNIQSFTFLASDFALPAQASAVEVANALNSRTTGLLTTVQPNRSLLITTTDASTQRLELDLHRSTGAREIGFGSHNNTSTTAWDDTLDWSPPEELLPAGGYADVSAVADASDTMWLFWAEQIGTTWQIRAMQNDHSGWSAPEPLTQGLVHSRTPRAVVDNDSNLWLFWAEQQPGATNADQWLLRRRVFDGVAWSAPAPVTELAAGHTADYEPAPVVLPDGSLRVFFRSDRSGGSDLWFCEVQVPSGAASAPEVVVITGDRESAPCPLRLADDRLWLLYRSDKNLVLTQAVNQPPINHTDTSVRLASTDTLRRFTGTTTISLNDTRRNSRQRRWDDRLSYTPEKVESLGTSGALVGNDFYTPNTIGIYISRTLADTMLTQRRIERLRQVLERALPANMRAVIIVSARVHIEYVYEPGNDIREDFFDAHPFIDAYGGISDMTRASLPDWIVLLSNNTDHISTDPSDLTSLRRRTYYRPFSED